MAQDPQAASFKASDDTSHSDRRVAGHRPTLYSAIAPYMPAGITAVSYTTEAVKLLGAYIGDPVAAERMLHEEVLTRLDECFMRVKQLDGQEGSRR